MYITQNYNLDITLNIKTKSKSYLFKFQIFTFIMIFIHAFFSQLLKIKAYSITSKMYPSADFCFNNTDNWTPCRRVQNLP